MQPKHFQAILERDTSALGWTVARLPFDPAQTWSEMVRLRVRGEINGFPFRTSLFPEPGGGGFHLLVNRTMQRAAGVTLGSSAHFTLQPDLEPRPAELPDELSALLDEEDGLRAWYDALTEYTRREIGKWINAVKSDEARLRRAEQMAERLLATMQAESELPPLIARALARKPAARAAWDRMPAGHRRTHLLAVFYYRTPEAQARRIDKMISACLEWAEKHPPRP